MTCARCGSEAPPDAEFCATCGAALPLPPLKGPGGRRIVLIAAALVIAAAAIGTVLTFALGGGPAGGGGRVTLPGPTRTASPTPPPGGPAAATASVSPGGGASPGGSASGPADPSGRATARPSGRPTARPTGRAATGPDVIIARSVRGNPHAAAAGALLNHYFAAINDHDYVAYLRLFGPHGGQALSAPAFLVGYGTTSDSAAVLTGLAPAGPGQLAATVTFTSHQSPAASRQHAACLHWRLTLYLVRRGAGYLIGAQPPGNEGAARIC